jgi:hypothetical protein
VLVAERTAGLPLHVEALLVGRRELSGALLSGSFAEIVAARIDLRSVACRRVLRILAVAGQPLTHAELADAAAAMNFPPDEIRSGPGRPRRARTGGPPELDADLAAGLAEAVESGFVTRDAGGVSVHHQATAAAIVDDLLPAARPQYHAALASALPARPAAAAHWRAAMQPALAAEAARAAADVAAALDATADELASLETALELATTGGPGARLDAAGRVELSLRAAAAALGAGLARRAVAHLEQIERCCCPTDRRQYGPGCMCSCCYGAKDYQNRDPESALWWTIHIGC